MIKNEPQQIKEINLIIKGLESQKINIFYDNSIDLNAKMFCFQAIENYYLLGIDYFLNKTWGYRKVYKSKSKLSPDAKLLGEFFNATYEICKESYFNQQLSGYSLPWKDGLTWFGHCLRDYLAIDLLDASANNGENNKRALLAKMKTRLRTLKSLEFPLPDRLHISEYNPYLKYGNDGLALVAMIESAYYLANKKPAFDKNYWKPYLASYEALIYRMESNNVVFKITGNEEALNVSFRATKNGAISNKSIRYSK
ncbi:MAG: hypothetical protein KME22_07705 [Hassallia sp. WJT32-NPBG1]|jgi:hypothetical protein|nr:hypothetical protein [Hassallia sp. WJT32-NPBG1]